jgi:hypothetical protein
MALLITNSSEECIASILRMERIGELGTPDDGGDMFLWNISSYKSHMVSHPRRWNSSTSRHENIKSYI